MAAHRHPQRSRSAGRDGRPLRAAVIGLVLSLLASLATTSSPAAAQPSPSPVAATTAAGAAPVSSRTAHPRTAGSTPCTYDPFNPLTCQRTSLALTVTPGQVARVLSGTMVTFTARPYTGTGEAQGVPDPAPTGTITIADATLGFVSEDPAMPCSQPIPLVNGVASCTASLSQVGTHQIALSYTGDAAYLGSSTSVAANVVKEPTTTAVTVQAGSGGTEAEVVVSPADGWITLHGTVSITATDLTDPATHLLPVSTEQTAAGKGQPITVHQPFSLLPGHSYHVAAQFIGDTNSEGSSAATDYTVGKTLPSLSVAVAAGDANAEVGSVVQATATLSNLASAPPAGGLTIYSEPALLSTATDAPPAAEYSHCSPAAGPAGPQSIWTPVPGQQGSYSASCSLRPSPGSSFFYGYFSGDSTIAPVLSEPSDAYQTTAAPIAIQLSTTVDGTPATSADADQTLTLRATAQFEPALATGDPVPDSIVSFYDSSIAGPASLLCSGLLSQGCAFSGFQPGTHVLTAVYPEVTGIVAQTSSAASTFVVTKVAAALSLAAAAVPGSPSGVSLSARLASDVADVTSGKVAFYAGGISDTPICTVIPTPATGPAGATARCEATLAAGHAQDYIATYVSRSTATVISNAAHFASAAVATSTVLAADQVTAPYGAGIRFTATISAQQAVSPDGTVDISVDGTVVPGCANLAVSPTGSAGGGSANCSRSDLHAGSHTALASYTGGVSTASSQSSAAPVTVTAAETTTAITGALPGADGIAVSVRVNSADAVVLGAVTIVVDGQPSDSRCQAVALDAGTLDCSVALPPTPGDYTMRASFLGAGDFAPSSVATQVTVRDSNEPCAAGFAKVWTDASAKTALDFAAGSLGTLSLTVSSTTNAACNAASQIQITGGKATLFSSLQATDLAGVISSDGICLTSGAFSAPASWRLPTISVSAPICLTLDASGNPFTLTGGGLTATSPGLPFADIPGVGPLTVQLSLGQRADGVRTMTIAAAGSLGGVTGSLEGTIATDGSIDGGMVNVGGVAILGNQVSFAGSFSRTAGGAVSIEASASIPGPVPVIAGLAASDVEVALGTEGISITGTAVLGAEPATTQAAFTGTLHSLTDYSLVLTSSGPAWSPVSGLQLHPQWSGTFSRDEKGYHYDVKASGVAADPLASWSPIPTLTLSLISVELSSEGQQCGSTDTSADPVLTVAGGVRAAAMTATLGGCIDLATRALNLTATADRVAISENLVITAVSAAIDSSANGVALQGSATGQLTAGGRSIDVPVSLHADRAAFVIGAGLDLTSWGLPVRSGYLAYASTAVDGFDTGVSDLPGGPLLNLPKGLTLLGDLDLPAAVRSALSRAGFVLPAGSGVRFAGSIGAGTITFQAELAAPADVPFLTLPGGTSVTSASLHYRAGSLTLSVAGAVATDGFPDAPIQLDVTISADGSFHGTASVTGLPVFGQPVTLIGSLDVAGTTRTYSLRAHLDGPILPVPSSTLALTAVDITLASTGLTASGAAAVNGLGNLLFSGSIASLTRYSLSVSGTASNWSPTPAVTVSAAISGKLSRDLSGVHLDLKASGNHEALFTLATNGVSVAVNSIELANTKAPAGCPAPSGHFWLAISGGVSVASLGSAVGDVTGAGCFDLTQPANFRFTAAVPSFDFNAGAASISDLEVTLSRSADAGFSADAKVTLAVTMPAGGTLRAIAQLSFESGGFVVGLKANLSSYLGQASGAGFVFYSTDEIASFDTGDSEFGSVHLVAGISVAVKVTVPAGSVPALKRMGLDLPSGGSVLAIGALDPEARALTLSIEAGFGKTGQTIFSTASHASLSLVSGGLQLTISPTVFSFGLRATTLLNLPPATPTGTSSSITLTGRILITDDAFTASLSASSWNDALGIPGLNMKGLTVQGGIDFEGIPSVGVSASITRLPSALATAIGYHQGAPINLAVNLSADQFLVALQIGSQDSGSIALEPLAAFGRASLIQVSYAQLYLSPDGAQIGDKVYPPGFALGLQANLAGVPIAVLAKVDPVTPSISFHGSVGQVRFGQVTLGPVAVTIEAGLGSTGVKVQFDGSLALGPSTVQAGPALRFTGSLNASAHFTLGVTGISASLDIVASVVGSAYEAQQVCVQYGFLPYPCDYQWKDGAPLEIRETNVGFSVDSSGLTVKIPNTLSSINFPFSSLASAASDSYHELGSATSSGDQAPALVGHFLAAGASSGPASSATLTGGTPTAGPSTAGPSTAGTPTAGSPTAGPYTAGPASSGAAARWLPAGALATPRTAASSVTLADGRTLVLGGADGPTPLNSAELYDPRTDRWSPAASMRHPRVGSTAVLLADGRVLVAGGADAAGPMASSELYDPVHDRWSAAGSLGTARQFASAALIAGGDVLVAGGRGAGSGKSTALASAELFDPATGRWSATASMASARMFSASTVLPDGSVLVAGGFGSGAVLNSAERYLPASGRWTGAASLKDARMMASATPLRSGEVLVVGYAPSAEIYDPAANRWTAAGTASDARTAIGTSALPGGEVLAAGGFSAGKASAAVEVFDPTTRTFRMAGPLPQPRFGNVITALPDGDVLVAGGSAVLGGSLATAVLYSTRSATPAANPAVPASPLARANRHTGGLFPVLGWTALACCAALLLCLVLVARRRRRASGR